MSRIGAKFSQKSYDKNHSVTCNVVKDFIDKHPNYDIISTKDENYGDYDMVIFSKERNRKEYIEFEKKYFWNVSGKWVDEKSGVHVSVRKKKSKANWFIMVNNLLDTLIVISMKEVKKAKIIEKKNKRDGYKELEQFFEIPIGKFRIFKKEKETWGET